MQILYKKSSTNIEQNIRDGSTLLKTYYRLTKSKDAAIQSYNIGIGSYYNGTRSTDYLEKVKKHTQKFKEIK
jgi:aspartate/tyrosine/aromatic aminotransferase